MKKFFFDFRNYKKLNKGIILKFEKNFFFNSYFFVFWVFFQNLIFFSNSVLLQLNVNVCDVDYSQMMSELKKQPEALVILVVDVTDLPGSIYPKLAQVVGSRRPMIVVGEQLFLGLATKKKMFKKILFHSFTKLIFFWESVFRSDKKLWKIYKLLKIWISISRQQSGSSASRRPYWIHVEIQKNCRKSRWKSWSFGEVCIFSEFILAGNWFFEKFQKKIWKFSLFARLQ